MAALSCRSLLAPIFLDLGIYMVLMMCVFLLQAAEMSERFELAHIESCMGGHLKAPLFDLEQYGQRMKVCGHGANLQTAAASAQDVLS